LETTKKSPLKFKRESKQHKSKLFVFIKSFSSYKIFFIVMPMAQMLVSSED